MSLTKVRLNTRDIPNSVADVPASVIICFRYLISREIQAKKDAFCIQKSAKDGTKYLFPFFITHSQSTH